MNVKIKSQTQISPSLQGMGGERRKRLVDESPKSEARPRREKSRRGHFFHNFECKAEKPEKNLKKFMKNSCNLKRNRL